ncbi:MAG: HAMP domain-containing protein [Candidatus Wallbacteria bacterium]|nr:HAMP domain-containing protein [Candidatus Wallbacteria bacterium]
MTEPQRTSGLARLTRPTIHLKVMLLIGAALCLLLAVTGYFALQSERRFLLSESEKRTRNLRRALEALSRLALTTGEEGPLREYIFRLTEEDRDVRSVTLHDRNGKPILVSGNRSTAGPGPDETQTSPIFVDGRFAGKVEVAYNSESLRALLGRMTGLILAAVVDSLLFLGLLLHLALKHFVTRPLEKFVRASNRIASGDFGAAIESSTQDELDELAAAFNHMSANLERFRAEIEASHRDLEDRVRQRTRELEIEMARARDLAQQVQHADRLSSLGTLAAGVAHELNNPLGNISTFVQILQEKPAVAGDLLAHCLANISLETERASRIVRKLLDFSRHRPARIEPISSAHLVRQALELLSVSLSDGRVQVALDLPDDLPPLLADPGAIVQVLVNLMTNALHAMPAGGRLGISARLEGSAVRLSLADTGVGIDPEHLGRIFDPFFTTKDVGKGTGLGLSVSYGIVREHGGQITVSSQPGQGTVFEVLLPTAPAPLVLAPAAGREAA